MNRAFRSEKTERFVPVRELKRFQDGWLLDCQYRQLSDETVANRRFLMGKFLWWLQTNEVDPCDSSEIKQFLAYISTAHTTPDGRWGNKHLRRPVRPRTVRDFHTTLRTFFRWLVEEGHLAESPMEGIKAPVARADQIQPFTQEQIAALLLAAKDSTHPYRDEAIVLFLLDTGVRSSELCGLRRQDIDVVGKRATVLGKGNKRRPVYFSRVTSRALNQYRRGRMANPATRSSSRSGKKPSPGPGSSNSCADLRGALGSRPFGAHRTRSATPAPSGSSETAARSSP